MRGLAFFFASFVLVSAQVQGWPLPPPLETAHLIGKGLPSGALPVALQDELYALGWSRSNAFALLERRALPEGRREVRFRIIDLVQDTVLVEETWSDWEQQGQDPWWEDHRSQVEAQFARFGLVPNTWQLGAFPLILDNEYYTAVLRTTASPSEPGWLTRLELLIHSTGRGLKTIKAQDGYWRWAALVGFLASPFENRLAVVLVVQPSGWLGEKQPLRFQVTGVSLKAGFPVP